MISEFQIAKLRLAPGDVLVVRARGCISSAQARALHGALVPQLPPGTKAIVIDDGIDLSVMTRSEIEARTA